LSITSYSSGHCPASDIIPVYRLPQNHWDYLHPPRPQSPTHTYKPSPTQLNNIHTRPNRLDCSQEHTPTSAEMHTPTITVKELPDSPGPSSNHPPSLSSSRNNSSGTYSTSGTHSKPSSTRNSLEADTSPYEGSEPARTKGNPLEERKRDYSLWLTRMMGKQLVKGLNDKEAGEGGD
jgi:hypothetical protein